MGTIPDLAEDDIVRLPVIEVNIGKNKITAFKEKLYFEFYPSSSDFLCLDEHIVISRMSEDDGKKKEFSAGSPFGSKNFSVK
jgi:hypothetical protein